MARAFIVLCAIIELIIGLFICEGKNGGEKRRKRLTFAVVGQFVKSRPKTGPFLRRNFPSFFPRNFEILNGQKSGENMRKKRGEKKDVPEQGLGKAGLRFPVVAQGVFLTIGPRE